uniref:LEM domain-containing protein n=1 Tax=Glossina brevipalpis TaxID=37001 RepID=A0A1A9WRX5_9MUSC
MLELEKLNNKELRKMCLEHGLPNVPVTNTSRNVLIKRLEAEISGKPYSPSPAKASSRRETVHVSAPAETTSSKLATMDNSSVEDNSVKVSNNRPTRHTLAVGERIVSTTTTTVSDPESSDVSPDRLISKQAYNMMQTPLKESLYPKLPAKEPSPKPVMLSKTDVVTTSYIQETKKNANKTYADMEAREQAIQSQTQPKSVFINQETTSSIKPTFISPLTYKSTKEFNPTMPSKLSSTSSYQSRLEPRATINKLPSHSYASPSKYYTKPQYADEYEDDEDDIVCVDEYDDDEDDDDNEEEYEDDVVVVEDSPLGKDVKTPFLSSFARNLENLKASPLAEKYSPLYGNVSNARQRESIGRRTIIPSSKVTSRPSWQTSSAKPDAANNSFRQFVCALEDKYHFKWPLFAIIVFILMVFVYVFLVQQI